jgi:uncharacterized RDD family membrane protein YckC
MSVCIACHSEILPGSRWCSICRVSALSPSQGTLASPGKRFGAFFLDAAAPFVALLLIAGIAAALGTIAWLFVLGYFVWALFLFSRGTTPGKNMLRLTVIGENGQPASFWRMLLREWPGRFLSGLFFGLGYLWILFDRDRQAWHDKLASTFVVDRGS